jgi:anti-sigma factor (TIGR02949 family)
MGRCDELITNLSDYIDGELEPELCDQLEQHLAGCNNCRLMVDNMKMTVKLCRDGICEDLPPALQEKLDNQLAERWKKQFGHL